MRRLDPAQAAAATGTAAIQLTLAGPGSGKTSTLTGRFVHLIRRGVDPRRILAVTFTKKAADEMRGRIAGLLELPSASGLNIVTFHAFAFRLLKRNPGLKGTLGESMQNGYSDGRYRAVAETNLPLSTFPHECPYAWDEMMSRAVNLEGEAF